MSIERVLFTIRVRHGSRSQHAEEVLLTLRRYCGTTADFCGDGCQSGCEKVNEPSVDAFKAP